MQCLPIVPRSRARRVLLTLLAPGILASQMAAQTASPDLRQADLGQITERLDRLEKQNQSLAEEVHQLRQELAEARGQPQAPPAAPALDEKAAVNESRVEELAQSKVEASQHFPIRVTGMALFNTFLNSQGSGGQQYPTFAWPGNQASGGGSFYQTTIGLDYSGPQIFGGGKVHGRSTWISRAAPARRWIWDSGCAPARSKSSGQTKASWRASRAPSSRRASPPR
jgi:cell division protein FtsB